MNRSTIIIVSIFAILLVVWLATGRETATTDIPPLVVEGFLDGEISLQDIKVLNKDEASPYKHFEIARKGERATLDVLPGEWSKKPSERKWKATRTRGGETWEAPGESYRVKMINQILARPFRSSYAFKVTPEELPDYLLDDANAVELIASSDDRKVHLRIGKSTKSDDESGSTWVQDPVQPDVVYQVAGHDLRIEVDVGWKDVRDRKILGLNTAEIDRIVIDNPRATDGLGHVVVTRSPLSDEQMAKLAEGAKVEEVRKSDEGWTIAEPSGYQAGEIGSWLDSIERMALTETFDTEGGKVPADSGLDDEHGAVRIQLAGQGKTYAFRIGGKAPKGDQGDVYVAVDGKTIVYAIASWSADQIIKTLDTLRDVRLLGDLKAEDCGVVQIRAGDSRFTATRREQTWVSEDIDLDPSNVDDYLRDLIGTRVEFKSTMKAADAGLATPVATISLTFGAKRTTIEVGKVGETTYARRDSVDIFTLQSWNADRLTRTGRDFINKHLLRRPKDQVSQIEIQDRKNFKILERKNGGWSVKGEATLAVEGPAVEALLDSLSTYQYHAEYDVDPKSVGLEPAPWTLRLTMSDGSRWRLSLSETRRDNNPYGTIESPGQKPRHVTISAMMIDAIKKTWSDVRSQNKP